jgi:hypothetical protein
MLRAACTVAVCILCVLMPLAALLHKRASATAACAFLMTKCSYALFWFCYQVVTLQYRLLDILLCSCACVPAASSFVVHLHMVVAFHNLTLSGSTL